MKIAISECKWTKWNHKYPTFWGEEDFFVYVGKTIDVVTDPFKIVFYHQLENIGAFMIASSAHEEDEKFRGEFGYPYFTDDFVVFKNNEVGRKIHNEFSASKHKNITQIMASNRIMPVLYPTSFVLVRCATDMKPEIVWGISDK